MTDQIYFKLKFSEKIPGKAEAKETQARLKSWRQAKTT